MQRGNLAPIIPAVQTGQGGVRLTPDEIKRSREVALALMQRGSDTSPIDHWSQGAARLVDALGGVAANRRADTAAQANTAWKNDAISRALGGGAASMSAPSAAPSPTVASALLQAPAPTETAAGAAGVPQALASTQPIELASSLLGAGEVPDRATIQEYLSNGGVNLDPATTAWCAAYVNATLAQTGFEGTGSNMARSFLNYGEAVDEPQRGDLAVFSRGDPNGPFGHVGFFDGLNENGTIRVLGGNQGNSVSIANYNPGSLLGYRRPVGAQEAIAQALVQPTQGSAAPVQVAQAGGGINPAIMELITSPFADDATRQIGQLLFQQETDARSAAQKRAFEIQDRNEQRGYDRYLTLDERGYDRTLRNEDFAREDARFAVTDRREDARLDLEQQRFARDGIQQPQWQELPNGDFGYFDPNTRQFERLGNAPRPDENGVTIGADGTIQIGGSQKPLTEGQAKDAVFSTRAAGSLPIIDQYETALTSRVDAGLGMVPFGFGRGYQNTEFQLAQQAGDEFLQAILRKDTGAAITSQEQALYGDTYLPRPGDSPELIQQKRASRGRALAAIEAGMPPAAMVQKELALRRSGNVGSPENPVQLDTVTVPSGVDPQDWEFMSPEERALFQ